ncbi:enoyl-CoA hydratase/isomerase family protein [Conexibacter sp. CPCC 206217]|uniref:enoyl-CoA hydratase/isomerase family protein n=1 Tax=Conexibacter sp. CPCC 206217 TaxID=3064574 RepID=UPI002720916C|nr:enoyl-CoA hydratase/isomerase family protein [Conexibacter sp. CPCC 206217]MDO8208882.1 enoyl-CoA hydratase/isomerase family protein [Conexibacter sp. CPCC 206217]
MSSAAGAIRIARDGAVATLTIDRPRSGNALDRAAVAELRAALAALPGEVELIVVRGAGGRSFCGGADSREMVALAPAERQQAMAAFGDCCVELWNHPALSVAVVDGYATGGGAHLACACDLRVLAPSAWLQFPSSRYGLNITAVWLTALVGAANATMLLGSAQRVDAATAERLGIAQAVGECDDALALLGLERPAGLREAKAAIRGASSPHLGSSLLAERNRAVELIARDRFVDSLSQEASVRGA